MFGLTLRDRTRNKELRRGTGVEDVIFYITKHNWNWDGHIVRMKDGRWTKTILKYWPRLDIRSGRSHQPVGWKTPKYRY